MDISQLDFYRNILKKSYVHASATMEKSKYFLAIGMLLMYSDA